MELDSNTSRPSNLPQQESAVNITRLNEHGMPVIDRDAIELLFGSKEVRHSPICIYSISGPMRMGKSLVLSLMLRYLQFKSNNKESEWKNDANAKVTDGFKYAHSVESQTKGIDVWSKPFWIETQEHGKVAVFLMDTQGLYDGESSENVDSTLFTLSTFLSSYQIYNLKTVINFSDLKRLKEFSLFCRRIFTGSDWEAYQSLLFLIRDWQDPKYKLGHEGGKKYLDKILDENQQKSAENKTFCDNIKKSFKNIECAIMRQPGESVTFHDGDEATITIGEIGDKFLNCCDNIFCKMFNEACVKKWKKHTLTGKDIANLANNISNSIELNKFGAKEMYKACAQLYLQQATIRCERNFFQSIEKKVQKAYRTPEQLKKIHEVSVKESIELFNKERKIGEPTEIDAYEKTLENSLNSRIFMFECYNKYLEAGVKTLYGNLLEKFDGCRTFHDHVMESIGDKDVVDEQKMEGALSKAKQKTLKKFDKMLEQNHINADIENEYRKQFKNLVDAEAKMHQTKNDLNKVKLHVSHRKNVFTILYQFVSVVNKAPMRTLYGDLWPDFYIHPWIHYNIMAMSTEFGTETERINRAAEWARKRFSDDQASPVMERNKEKLTNTLEEITKVFKERADIKKRIADVPDFPVTFERVATLVAQVVQNEPKAYDDGAPKRVTDLILDGLPTQKRANTHLTVKTMCKNELQLQMFGRNQKKEIEQINVLEAEVLAIDGLINSKPKTREKNWTEYYILSRTFLKNKLPFAKQNSLAKAVEEDKKQLEAARTLFAKEVRPISDKTFIEQRKKSMEKMLNSIKECWEGRRAYEKKLVTNRVEKVKMTIIWKHCQEINEELEAKSVTPDFIRKVKKEIISKFTTECHLIAENDEVLDQLIKSFEIAINRQMSDWEKVNQFHKGVFSRELNKWEDFWFSFKHGVKYTFSQWISNIEIQVSPSKVNT